MKNIISFQSFGFSGQELSESDNIRIVDSNADNNHTNSLEIGQVTALDAGRYSVTCR